MSGLHIYFDIDWVLVDVFSNWCELCRKWAKILGCDVDEVMRIGEQIWNNGGLYSPEKHLLRLGLIQSIEAIWILKGFYAWLDDGGAVYGDVRELFETHNGSEHLFSVATFGSEVYQHRKIRSLPIVRNSFQDIIVTSLSGQKGSRIVESTQNPGYRVVLLDDNPFEHKRAAWYGTSIIRVQIIRNNRVARARHADHCVRDLKEFTELLPRL
jgi:hypothetical protein